MSKQASRSFAANANRRFKFHKRSQLFLRAHNVTLSVAAMRVSNPDRSPLRIKPETQPQLPTGFLEDCQR